MDPTVYAEAPRQSLRELSRDKKMVAMRCF